MARIALWLRDGHWDFCRVVTGPMPALSAPNPVEIRSAGALRPAYRMAVLALLVLMAAEIFLSSRQESQVWDEADHLYAGYQYWKHGDFGWNPEHPPLIKLAAASALLPLHLAEPNDPYSDFKARDF